MNRDDVALMTRGVFPSISLMIHSSPHLSDSVPTTLRPLVVGHRGASDVAPENTRSAIEAAISGGCDGVEIDVQMTRDHVPILYHDRTLHKINGRWARVAAQKIEQLRKLDWGKWYSPTFEGEKVLTLADVLKDYASRTRLFLEIKSHKAERRSRHTLRLTNIVMEMLRSLVPEPSRRHVLLLSFDLDVLTHANRLDSKWRYIWNLENTDLSGLPDFISAICVPVIKLSSHLVQEAHRMGRQVMTYTCNTPQQADLALATGPDVLMTDRPAWLVHYLNEGNARL